MKNKNPRMGQKQKRAVSIRSSKGSPRVESAGHASGSFPIVGLGASAGGLEAL